MSEYRGVVSVYVGDELLGQVEARDPDMNTVLADLEGLGARLAARIVRDVLKSQTPERVLAMLTAAREGREDF